MNPDILVQHINANVFSQKHYAQNLVDYLTNNFRQISLATK